jgi:phosphoribosylglycinamide formyltransferase-1
MPAPVTPSHTTDTPRVPRLAVFVSGGGRTFMNLHDRIRTGTLRAQIVLVVASSQCPAVPRAAERGIPCEVHPGEIPPERLREILRPYAPDYLVLAGYLKRLAILPEFVGRVVNIHPALLPKFGGPGMYGRRVHEAVLAAGDPESGCTVHLCDEAYDRGEIILQRRCPVLPDDTPDTLAARVFAEECEAYPAALARLFEKHRTSPGV